jgi:hypothetical protein
MYNEYLKIHQYERLWQVIATQVTSAGRFDASGLRSLPNGYWVRFPVVTLNFLRVSLKIPKK